MHLSIYFSLRLRHQASIPAFPFLQMPNFDLRKQQPCQGRHPATEHSISVIKAISSAAVHVQEESLLALTESPLLRLAFCYQFDITNRQAEPLVVQAL
jgi:hypothetical protein